MIWAFVADMVAAILFGRILIRRSLGCLFWVGLVVVLFILAAPFLAHAEEPARPMIFPLSQGTDGTLWHEARGLIYRTQSTFCLPSLAPGARALLTASRDGKQPIEGDDFLRVRFSGSTGRDFSFERDFRQPDHKGIEPFGPVDVTGLLPEGDVTVTVELIDLQPPLFGLSPLYLVITSGASASAANDQQLEGGCSSGTSNASGNTISSKGDEANILFIIGVGLAAIGVAAMGLFVVRIGSQIFWARVRKETEFDALRS